MNLIEGVGDEVTISVGFLVLLIILTLAWVSTGVADRPFMSVIILDRQTFQHFLSRLRGRGRPTVTEPQNAGPSEPTEDQGASVDSSPADSSETSEPTQTQSEPTQTQSEPTQTQSEPTQTQSEPAAEPSPPPVVETEREGQVEPSISEQPNQDTLRQRRLHFFDHGEGGSHCEPADSTSTSTHRSEQPGTEAKQPGSDSTPNPSQPNLADDITPLEGHIRIKLKYLDDRQRWVQAKPEDTIGHFKRTHFSSEMTGNSVVRIIYNGRELARENASLASYNVGDESVIHCLVSQVTPQNTENINAQQPLDIGSLMFPLFGLILVLLWYSRFTYKQFFSTMSTLTLVGISLLFLISLVASFRNQEPRHVDVN